MECLLMTGWSLDACWSKQVSDFQAALHQNQKLATETIREAKAHCMVTVREAESHCVAEIREAELFCSSGPLYPTIPFRKHAVPQGGGKRLPFLPIHLWGSTAGLSPKCSWDTNVPSPFAHREHVFHHSLVPSPSGICYKGGIYSYVYPGGTHTLPRG